MMELASCQRRAIATFEDSLKCEDDKAADQQGFQLYERRAAKQVHTLQQRLALSKEKATNATHDLTSCKEDKIQTSVNFVTCYEGRAVDYLRFHEINMRADAKFNTLSSQINDLEQGLAQRDQSLVEQNAKIDKYCEKIIELTLLLKESDEANRSLLMREADMQGRIEQLAVSLSTVRQELGKQADKANQEAKKRRDAEGELLRTMSDGLLWMWRYKTVLEDQGVVQKQSKNDQARILEIEAEKQGLEDQLAKARDALEENHFLQGPASVLLSLVAWGAKAGDSTKGSKL